MRKNLTGGETMYLHELLSLQRDLDSLFGTEMFPGFSFSHKRFPAVNIFEKDDCLLVKAEVAGLNKKDIDIEIKEGYLKLSGKRELEPKEGFYHRRERESGTFERLFKLPYHVDSEKVRASYDNGILTVEMEKAEAAKGRKIAIK
jgi:HSP20 family protein